MHQWLLLQFLVLLMMGAESARNIYSDLAVTNKRYCQSCILLILYIIYILCSLTPPPDPPKICAIYEIIWKSILQPARQTDKLQYKMALRIFDTCSFSMTTMLTRTRLTLPVLVQTVQNLLVP